MNITSPTNTSRTEHPLNEPDILTTIFGPSRFPLSRPWYRDGRRQAPRASYQLRFTVEGGVEIVSALSNRIFAYFGTGTLFENLDFAIAWCVTKRSTFFDQSRSSLYDCEAGIRYVVPAAINPSEFLN